MLNDSSAPNSTPVPPPAPLFAIPLDPIEVLKALADPVRYRLLRECATGKGRAVKDLAESVGHTPALVSHHLGYLREAQLLQSHAPESDHRQLCYQVPSACVSRGAGNSIAIDYGCVLLRFE
jgi:predicted transcriptional regulator